MSVNASAAADRAAGGLSGDSIIREINASGIEFVISVPDITTSEGLLRPLAKGAGPKLVRICKEDEGVAICAGLATTGKRGLLLIQQTGLLNSINAIRGVAVEYSLPICMMVGLLEKEVGVMPRQSNALRGAHRRADPGGDGHRLSQHRGARRTSPKSARPSTPRSRTASPP